MDTNWKSRVWNSSSISLDKCASLALALLFFFFCECHRHKTQVWKKRGEQNERSWHVKRSCQMNNMIDFQCFCPTWWFWWFTTSLMERNYLRPFSSTSFSISWGSSTRDCSQRKATQRKFPHYSVASLERRESRKLETLPQLCDFLRKLFLGQVFTQRMLFVERHNVFDLFLFCLLPSLC